MHFLLDALVQSVWVFLSRFAHTFPSTHLPVVSFQKQFKYSAGSVLATFKILVLQEFLPKPLQVAGIGAHTLFAVPTTQRGLPFASFNHAIQSL